MKEYIAEWAVEIVNDSIGNKRAVKETAKKFGISNLIVYMVAIK